MPYEQLKLDNQLCFKFYTASRLITQAYRPFLSKLGITYPQYITLMVLWEKDAQPVNDIARRLVLNTNTITPLLQRMEKDGLVIREAAADDRRKVIVKLTDKGRKMENEAAGIPSQMTGMFTCANLKIDDLAGLAPLIDKVIGVMEQR